VDLGSIVSARIHPGIGIARVGNSIDSGEAGYFIGPEVTKPVLREPGFYRDKQGRLKRQAARFRVYGYDKHNRLVGELTAADAEIQWTVHVANKKAAWYDFDIALDLPEAVGIRSARRNAQIQGEDRRRLIIDAGPCNIAGRLRDAPPLVGRFFGHDVYLGELRTDEEGRLLFLGGLGRSGTPFRDFFPPSTFANNPCWHDDISDGPVSARVWIGKHEIEIVESAWVIVTPPNFAPDLIANQTMYDVIADALSGRMLPQRDSGNPPSFTEDILPLFRHFQDAQWLNAGFFRQFGWQGMIDFTRPEFLEALSRVPQADPNHPFRKIDPFKELRLLVLSQFRDPDATVFQPLRWPPVFGDAYGNPVSPPSPREGFAITRSLFQSLQQWASGNFVADYDPLGETPGSLEEVEPTRRPEMLDRAALTFCMGGPFHPGIEVTWPLRIVSMFQSPFRLRRRPADFPEADYGEFLTSSLVLSRDGPLSASGPGDITRWMSVPWQTDMASCRPGYRGADFPDDDFLPAFWVSRVPGHVLTEANYRIITDPKPTRTREDRLAAFQERADWTRSLNPHDPYVDVITRMVRNFGELGIIERRDLPEAIPGLPPVMYIETVPSGAALSGHPHSGVNQDLRSARFRHLKK
jgi:hypothetical protein